MKIVLVGGSGNLGTALLRRLAADGAHQLVGVVRRPPPSEPPYAGVTWHAADVSTDASADVLAEAVRGADAVVNLAWGFQPSHRPDYLAQVGPGGTRRVAAAVEAQGVPHLVQLSSVGAYAPKTDDRPVDESWPATGVPTSVYSRHKATAESFLDELEARGRTVVARPRPGIVLQREAGSAFMRYGLPGSTPGRVLDLLPVLPLDARFVIPVVHTDDVADALARIITQQAAGPFNLAADEPLTRADVAAVFDARPVQLPSRVLRTVVDLTWRAHLQPLDPGWIDLAFAVPLMDTSRARDELGWAPTVGARAALAEAVGGMADGAGTASPVLRHRSALADLRNALTSGPISRRLRP